jgi:ketosteroid isomerase-like protein
MDTTEENRRLVVHVLDELSRGNAEPFYEALADNVRWRTPGRSVWSRTFDGKTAVLDDLLAHVHAQFVGGIKLTLKSVIADGDRVAAEATGEAMTTSGQPYNNEYCFVYRIANGKIVELTEYLDTDLAAKTLKAPWASAT